MRSMKSEMTNYKVYYLYLYVVHFFKLQYLI
jgi:hypothetical protein